MASAVGNANFGVEFVFPTSKEMGHPFPRNLKIGIGRRISPWRPRKAQKESTRCLAAIPVLSGGERSHKLLIRSRLRSRSNDLR